MQFNLTYRNISHKVTSAGPHLDVGLQQGPLVDKARVLLDKYDLITYIKQPITWCLSVVYKSIINLVLITISRGTYKLS